MRVNKIKVRRNKASNSNSYVHKHIEVEIDVNEDDDLNEAFEYADFLIAKQFGEIRESEIRKHQKFAKFLQAGQ